MPFTWEFTGATGLADSMPTASERLSPELTRSLACLCVTIAHPMSPGLELIDAVLAFSKGEIAKLDLQRLVHRRDRTLWLEMEASAFNVHVLDLLVQEFSDARFILTIRDCYSWVDSALNHQLGRSLPKHYKSFLRYWVAPGSEYTRAELVLKDNGLYPLKSYFRAWANHNQRVLDTVPADRLLVIRTDEISKSSERIAEFLGIPARTLDRTPLLEPQEIRPVVRCRPGLREGGGPRGLQAADAAFFSGAY